MSESIFYLKVSCSSKKRAKEIDSRITEVVDQFSEAYVFWQKNRNNFPRDFWKRFKKEFPLVVKVLGGVVRLEGSPDNLSGYLDYGAEDDLHDGPFARGKEVRYSAEVWAHGTWEPLVKWIRKTLKPKSVKWADEAEIDPFAGF